MGKHLLKARLASLGLFVLCTVAVAGSMYWYVDRFSDKTVYVARKQWNPAEPEEMRFDSRRLARAIAYVENRLPTARSLIVLREGRTVVEKYFWKGGPDVADRLHRLELPVLQLLVGVALDRGLLPAPDVSLAALFPGATARAWPGVPLSLADLLELRAALMWGRNQPGYWALYYAPDRVEAALRVVRERRGTRDPALAAAAGLLLRAALEGASGMPVARFAATHLFAPMGLAAASRTGAGAGGGDLAGFALRALDLAKLGQLIARRGEWNGKQLVSARWVARVALRPRPVEDEVLLAGRWNVASFAGHRAFVAVGDGGQYLAIVPERDLVVVTTATGRFPLPRDAGRDRLLSLLVHAALGDLERERPRADTDWLDADGYVPPNVLASEPVPPDILEFLEAFARDVHRREPRRVLRHYARAYERSDLGFRSVGRFWGRIYAGGPGDVESVRIDRVRVEGGRAYLRGGMKLAYKDMSRGSLGWFELENLIRLKGRWRWLGTPRHAAILDRDEYFDAELPPEIGAFLARCAPALAGRPGAPQDCFVPGFDLGGLTARALVERVASVFGGERAPEVHVTGVEAVEGGYRVGGYLAGSALGELPLPAGLGLVPRGEGWRWWGNGPAVAGQRAP